jgi:predicted helicase
LDFIPDSQGDGKTNFGPEDVFYYAYAVFHSPTYRQRYAEFLRIDFPRLPITSNKELFFVLVRKGKELVELHSLKSTKVDEFITSYPVAGDDEVEKVVYVPESPHSIERSIGNVWINSKQYFGKVPEKVWNYKVGGYQVCEKWLKDRKGRILSGDDISHYQRVVVALTETIQIMEEIDQVIPGWPLE